MGSSTKKLIFVVNEAASFLSHRCQLAAAAHEREGYEVHVASHASPDVAEIQRRGFIHHEIFLDRCSVNPLKDIKTFLSIAKLYLRVKPDIVHHVTVKPILYGGAASMLLRVPAAINAVAGLGRVFIRTGALRAGLRLLVKIGFFFAFSHPNSRTIFQNEDDRGRILKSRLVSKRKSVLIKGSGVDTELFVPAKKVPEGLPVVVLPARLLWSKGVREFYHAAKIVKQKTCVRIVLAGAPDPGNPESVSQATLDQWQKDGVIDAWGWHTDMASLYRHCHIACLPSYQEGLPKALIEAAACGLPIITTDAPGCREVVTHGVNGLLVPVQNVELLADAMEALVNHPDVRIRMGKQSRLMAEQHFSLSHVIDSTLALYREVVVT